MLQFRQITLNLIYFINILLIFLFLFEDKVELPVFLQVGGRLHPLVLHFPLALLFVGIFLEWLTSRKAFQHPATREITSCIFYLFALAAAITALFGFFLHREGAYQGDAVTWHKWTGLAVSLLGVLILWLKETPAVVYYSTLGVSAIALIVAGHLGAEITHGEGFLTEPIRKHWPATVVVEHVDSAVIFRDVIQPILNEKCINCHNPNKAKNDLILADYQHIIKGGKSGEVLVAGAAEESLLYKYALLPMSDSLHMPPEGKLQLDPEEIQLIGWWINSGAHPEVKYVSVAKADSIHPLMLSRFQPKTGLDLVDIPFADPEELESLNNPYRTVQQLSASKPYVAVFLGSKTDFSPQDLADLKGIRNQIVSIDIGNSEIQENELKDLKDFPHLRKLHLQNVAIGDEGVKQLRDLSYLESLNLSGTNISAKTLEEIEGWKHLKKLFLYNTRIGEEQVQALTKANPDLTVYNTKFDLSDSVYNVQLTMPVCKIDSMFFREKALVSIKLSRGKVKYYYTLDGTQPGSLANLYTEPFYVDQTADLKIIATMDGWIDSKVVSFPLLKLGKRPARVTLETKPDPKFAAKLDSTLVDGKSGSLNRGDKEYLGFTKQDLEVLFEMEDPTTLSRFSMSFLEDSGKGIFPPGHVEIWGGEDKNKLVKLGEVKTDTPMEMRSSVKGIIRIDFPEQSVRFVRVKAKRAKTLPAGHPNVNTATPSVFVDEVALE